MLTVAMFAIAVSCNKEKDYDREMYENNVYLLSASGTANIYTASYDLKEGESTKYLSIGIGGSKPNPTEISVTLEEDTVLLDSYNKNNFDIDSSAFAKTLKPELYQALPTVVTIPANPADPYVQVPVTVNPVSLSPDSIYFIPLAIKSVSGGYTANPDKFNVLYRVTIKNDYAEQSSTTRYTVNGTILDAANKSTLLSGTRIVRPLTANSIRLFAAGVSGVIPSEDDSRKIDVDELAQKVKYSVTVQVNPDQSVTVLPYGSIQVDNIPLSGYNKYAEEELNGTIYKRFYLSYRYRLQNTAGSETSDPTWGAWYTVKETLTRN
jgi:hypothetical protein